jgi:hypothetical protein
MLRPFLYEFMLFVLPFLAYAAYLLARKRNGFSLQGWERAPFLMLLALGVACVGVGLALFAHFGGVPAGSAYIPAHMENGKLIEPQ